MNNKHEDDEPLEMVEKNDPDNTRDFGYSPVAKKEKSSPPRGGSATSSSKDNKGNTNKED